MSYSIQFGTIESYAIYISTIIMATFYASLSRNLQFKTRSSGKKLNWMFLMLSFLTLAIPLIFRESGVDNDGYMQIYNNIGNWRNGILQNYQGFPEPLFMLLNYIIIMTVNNFQFVYILSGIISLLFMYKALSKKNDELNFALLIWIFSFSLYFYMYGLVRLLIAVSIMTYALSYLEIKNIRKFISWGIIAGLFHYSAFVIIPIFILISKISMNSTKKFNFIKSAATSILLIPGIFIISIQIFVKMFSNFSWFGRYHKYLAIDTISFPVLKNIVWILPILIILIVYASYFEKRVRYFKFHANLLFAMISFAILGVFFGVQRLIYFMYPSCFYLYASVLKLPFSIKEQKIIKLFFWIGMVILGLFWLVVVILGGDNWKPYMIPYRFYIR